jgi:hypothetical protein
MTMTRARVRVLLTTAWMITNLLLIFVASVPMWLAFIGNLAGAAVIGRYLRAFREAPLSRVEKVLRSGAFVLLRAVAAFFALLLVVTMLAFLVAWLATCDRSSTLRRPI